MERQTEYYVVAYVPFQIGIGFALPILASQKDSKQLFVQEIDEFSSLVSGFRSVASDETTLIRLETHNAIRVGEKPAYCFILDAQRIYTGTLQQLEDVLTRVLLAQPERKDICLQILELIGSDEQKRYARAGMRSALQDSVGEAPAREFHEGSVLRTTLWSILLDAAPNAEAARRVLLARPNLSIKIDFSGTIHLDLSAVEPSDYGNLSVEHILLRIDEQFDRSIAQSRVESLNEQRSGSYSRIKLVEDEIHYIKSHRKQEDRISIMISRLLEDWKLGQNILADYGSDKAKFANLQFKILKQLVKSVEDPNYREISLAKFIAQSIKEAYPIRSGEFLLSLARHLSTYPNINSVIKEKVEKSGAFSTYNHRSEIIRYLSGAKERE